jgi:hypothetical protein
MIQPSSSVLRYSLFLPLLVAIACSGGESEPSGGDGDGDSTGDGDTGDGDTGDGDAGDGDVGSEAPADCAILDDVVGEYTVIGPPTENAQRGESTAEHQRGSISIAADYSIDFDTGIAFGPLDITACYDRTTQDFDRRIQVSYGADDNGEVINVYLNDALEVEEVQFRDNANSINIRVLVE